MKIKRIIIAGCVLAGTAVAGTATGALASSLTTNQGANFVAQQSFPRNADGLTYGSAAGLTNDALPQLIAAEGSNGASGFVKASDLLAAEGPIAATPAEAVKLAARSQTVTIPVYSLAGKQIGTLTVGGEGQEVTAP